MNTNSKIHEYRTEFSRNSKQSVFKAKNNKVIKTKMENVLNPELMWIGGRCYRINPSSDVKTNEEKAPVKGYVEEDLYDENEEDDIDYEIETINNGKKFKTSVHVNSIFFGAIIGTKGSVRMRLEKETKTQINVPKIGQTGDIIITGFTRSSVVTCRRRINMIVMAGKQKQDFTHFISIPCNSSEIIENFEKFKRDILEDREIVVDESAFQKPGKLHQTVVPIVLLDTEDRVNAAECLQECKTTIIDPYFANRKGKLLLKLSGIEIMNDDPSAVNVLYAKIDSEEVQDLCNRMMEVFVKKELISKQYDRVKMHITLINTRYQSQKQNENQGGKNRGPKIKFDARKILEKYQNFYFGTIELNEFHLSTRYTEAANGFYEASAIIKV